MFNPYWYLLPFALLVFISALLLVELYKAFTKGKTFFGGARSPGMPSAIRGAYEYKKDKLGFIIVVIVNLCLLVLSLVFAKEILLDFLEAL